MKKTRKAFKVWLALLLIFCIFTTFSGCGSYCDPKGKTWYNFVSLPDMSDPFREEYDGSNFIQIKNNGDVLFKPRNGEEVKGKLSTSTNSRYAWTDVSIEFENGKKATGDCSKTDTGRVLRIIYGTNGYTFSDKKQYSKEEFETYRSQLIEFLTNVYKTGNFPSQQEIESNSLYKKFTNYFQIDPGCGGPFVYRIAEKAIIERFTITGYDKEIALNINGESVIREFVEEDFFVASIENGGIQELSLSDLKEGECLVVRENFYDGSDGSIFYDGSTYGIFYIANNAAKNIIT